MLTRAQKEEQVGQLAEKFSRAKCVYIADYRGIDVEAANALRRRIRTEGAGDFEYHVTKNTLLRRACGDTDMAPLVEHFQGPTAVALSYGDPVGLAKILADFSEDHEVFSLKGGVLEGEVLDSAAIAKVATLPSLEELRARIVGLLQAPATKLVRLLGEPGAGVARVFAARSRQESES